VCRNSVTSDGISGSYPGAYGLAYNPDTHHILEVANELETVEAVDYTGYSTPIPTTASPAWPIGGSGYVYGSVEVIQFVPAAAYVHSTTNPNAIYYNLPNPDGTMAVTNWAAGTIYLGAAV